LMSVLSEYSARSKYIHNSIISFPLQFLKHVTFVQGSVLAAVPPAISKVLPCAESPGLKFPRFCWQTVWNGVSLRS
jgi:hypothetical protein